MRYYTRIDSSFIIYWVNDENIIWYADFNGVALYSELNKRENPKRELKQYNIDDVFKIHEYYFENNIFYIRDVLKELVNGS